MTKKPLFYIAGPYSHPDEEVRVFRENQHCKYASELQMNGYLIYSPIAETVSLAKHGKLLGTSWDTWREKDLRMLESCDELLVLTIPGWTDSIGTKAEVKYALQNNKPVSLLDLKLMCIFDIETNALLRYLGVSKIEDLPN